MKANKLFKKLALSGVALGAAAVTLTATTFAWYTQNNEVQVGSVSGLTTTEADTGSIYLSAASSYTNSSDLNVAATGWTTPGSSANPTKVVDGTLTPVNYQEYRALSGASAPSGSSVKSEAVYKAFDSKNIIQYRLRLRAATAGTSMPVYLSDFQINAYKLASSSDTTGTSITAASELPTLVGLAKAGGVSENTAYGADIRKALKMTVAEFDRNATGTSVSDSTDFDNYGYSITPSRTTVYGFTNFAVDDQDLSSTDGIDALTYYNTVTGASLSRPDHYLGQTSTSTDVQEVALNQATSSSLTEQTALTFVTIPDTGYVEILITFWLDGWDEYCFDVMRSQKFTCSMKLTSAYQDAKVAK